jgi:hypothetical protein
MSASEKDQSFDQLGGDNLAADVQSGVVQSHDK